MKALAAFKNLLQSTGRTKTERKQPGEPEAAYGRPRPMTGFLATLTDEQREAVLAFKGPDLLGDPGKVK